MRFASQAGIFRAARHPLKVWDKTAAGIEDPAKVGLKGSPTVVSKVFAPKPKTTKAEIITCESNTPKDLAVTLIAKLMTQNPQLESAIGQSAR